MLIKVTFLILLSRFPNKTSCARGCIPNSYIYLNEKLCHCDSSGTWKEPICNGILGRRQLCRAGHVTVHGCTRCVCQDNGQYSCVEQGCASDPSSAHEDLAKILPWCHPFRTYYINCNICVCPASGKTIEAGCALDVSCPFFGDPSPTEIAARKTRCIPKVMYLFSCLHCLCSDDGYFNMKKCVVTCTKDKHNPTARRCIPNTLYRQGCNVCVCPDDGVAGDGLCTNNTCGASISFSFLRTLKDKQMKCNPHEFLKPRCVYCDCNQDGGIDEKTCLDLECLQNENLKYDTPRESCSPGEMVPFCMECLCSRNGVTSDDYCSKACSYQSKLKVLDRIIAMPDFNSIIDKKSITTSSGKEICTPNSIYADADKVCICPDTGVTNFNLCTAMAKGEPTTSAPHVSIQFNTTCEPNTFVDFDCNTCFCSKKGNIDPKWCTYDDCEAKRVIQESHKVHPAEPQPEPAIPLPDTCNPGSISNVECNFCICPDSGFVEDKVCTKNNCSAFTKHPAIDKFACEPLAYYEVDCNICYCPKDGIKNVAKCTKNHCDKSILRSDACAAGQLFSAECNVCVCPPSGNKAERACTNYTCADSAPWKQIFQLSESLLGNQLAVDDPTRNLDLCFPGEEFVVACKICVCPEVGLKMYATCSPSFCDDGSAFKQNAETSAVGNIGDTQTHSGNALYRKLETRREICMTVNVTNTSSRKKCTPGSMYIIKCRQCICPYAGSIDHYCRPLPDDFYCEQAYPKQNFLPMGRRQQEKIGNVTDTVLTTISSIAKDSTAPAPVPAVLHEHTRYHCTSRGDITDDCFRCECDGSAIIEQHCFQNTSKHCEGLKPSFLYDDVDRITSKVDFT